MYCESSLLALSSLLKDNFVLSFLESFCKNDQSLVSLSHHELLVCNRFHLLVDPEVEPAVLGV